MTSASIASTLLLLLSVGLIAEINAGQIIGSVAAARAGARQGWAFVAGTVASRLVQAVVGAGFATAVANELLGAIKLSRLAYALIALAGLAVVLEGLRMAIRRRRGEVPPPQTTDITKRIGVTSAAASGFLINIVYLPNWIYVSVAVTNIAVLNAGPVESATMFAFFIVVSTWIGVWLSALRLARPGRATAVIDRVGDWTDTHAPVILIWIVIVAGAAMIVLGLFGAFGNPLFT